MTSKLFRALGASALLIASACGAETAPSSTAQPLVSDAAVPLITSNVQVPEDVDVEDPLLHRVRAQTNVAESCSLQICAADEQCCVHTGECVPVDCDDCCLGPALAGGTPPDPELDGPEQPDEPE